MEQKPKFQIGDLVRIAPSVDENRYRNHPIGFAPTMRQYYKRVGLVIDVWHNDKTNTHCYQVAIDNNRDRKRSFAWLEDDLTEFDPLDCDYTTYEVYASWFEKHQGFVGTIEVPVSACDATPAMPTELEINGHIYTLTQ
jgi:hypothetical protein